MPVLVLVKKLSYDDLPIPVEVNCSRWIFQPNESGSIKSLDFGGSSREW